MNKLDDKDLFLQNIIKSALESSEFRNNLISDPKKSFEMRMKTHLPDNFEIVVHEDTPNRLNIVLPLKSDELSEAELSAVSGGICWDNCDVEI